MKFEPKTYFLTQILIQYLISLYKHHWENKNKILFVDMGSIALEDKTLTVTGKKLAKFFQDVGVEEKK